MRFLEAVMAVLCWLAPLEALAQTGPAEAGPPRNTHPIAALKPGQSAGIKAAQETRVGLALVGTGAVLAVVAVAAAGGNSHSSQPNSQMVPTTTTP